MDPLSEPTRCEVRCRVVLGQGGFETQTPFVICPREEADVSPERCRDCPHLRASGGDFVVCEGQAKSPPRRAAHALRSGFDSVSVGDVMGTEIVCVREDASLDDLTALLVERGITGVPVVDEESRPVGMVSKSDLVWEDYEAQEDVPDLPRSTLRVGDLMARSAITARLDTSVLDAAIRMADEGLHRLPVVDAKGRVVGILSALDVLRALAAYATP